MQKLSCLPGLVRTSRAVSSHVSSSSSRQTSSSPGAGSPVCSWNEWDPLVEVIVGRAEGYRIPHLQPNLKAKTLPPAWQWMQEKGGQPHEPKVIEGASQQVEGFCRVLQAEGVRVRRPEPIRWDLLGNFKTPYFQEGGHMNACPRDGLLVVGDEIIESSMGWRARTFEVYPYRNLLNEYFRAGARWTAAPRPTMRDHCYKQDYPYEDIAAREEMNKDGEYVLTEEEVVFDAADAARFGRDIFVTIGNSTNHGGVEWLRRHLAPRGIRVHTVIVKDIHATHADATFVPLKPGVMIVSPPRPCLQINGRPTKGWDWFTRRGWDVYEGPPTVLLKPMHLVSSWLNLNVLSLDEERVIIQKGEEPVRKMLIKLGLKPIEVDMKEAFHLGGAFHCWTLDVKRQGILEDYFL